MEALPWGLLTLLLPLLLMLRRASAVDDGTATVDVTVFRKVAGSARSGAHWTSCSAQLGSVAQTEADERPRHQLQLGGLVHVRGKLSVYRGRKQIVAQGIRASASVAGITRVSLAQAWAAGWTQARSTTAIKKPSSGRRPWC